MARWIFILLSSLSLPPSSFLSSWIFCNASPTFFHEMKINKKESENLQFPYLAACYSTSRPPPLPAPVRRCSPFLKRVKLGRSKQTLSGTNIRTKIYLPSFMMYVPIYKTNQLLKTFCYFQQNSFWEKRRTNETHYKIKLV